MSPGCCELPGGDAGSLGLGGEEEARPSRPLLMEGPGEGPCTASVPAGRDELLPYSSLELQRPGEEGSCPGPQPGRGGVERDPTLPGSCPERSGRACGDRQPQNTRGPCVKSSWVTSERWHGDTVPETIFVSPLGKGEKGKARIHQVNKEWAP